MTTSRTMPRDWMWKDGNSKTKKDDIIKTARGWEKIHIDGHKEVICTLNAPGNVAPYIVGITNHANGVYDNEADLSFVVEFSEIVNVVTTDGTPALQVYTEAGTVIDIPYASGSGTTELTFTGPATAAADGTLLLLTEIELNDGTILDASGNWLNNDFPSDYVQPTGIIINDGVLLSITNPADDYYDTNSTVSFTATFSEAMTVDTAEGTPTITVYTDSEDLYTCSYASGSGTTELVFTGDLSGMADGNLVVDEQIELNGGTILDADDNAPDSLAFPASYEQPSMVFVDAVITSVTNHADGIYANEVSLEFTVAYSEAVVVDTAGGTPSLQVYVNDDFANPIDLPYDSGSGTTELVFTGNLTELTNGTIGVIAALSTNGGTIVGQSTSAASVAFPLDYAQPDIEIYDARITLVTNPADDTYDDTQALAFSLEFNEAVVVDEIGGTPSVQVYTEIGTLIDVPYASGTGTTTLVFSGALTGIADGSLVVVETLALNGGTILGSTDDSIYLAFPDAYAQPTITMTTP